MRKTGYLTTVMVLTGALAFAPGAVAFAQGWGGTGKSNAAAGISEEKVEMRSVQGEVTAVEPNAQTMVVTAMEGKTSLDVGVDVPNKTIIREGQAIKTLNDIKVGDRVAMKYEKTSSGLTAESIKILGPMSKIAKDKSS